MYDVVSSAPTLLQWFFADPTIMLLVAGVTEAAGSALGGIQANQTAKANASIDELNARQAGSLGAQQEAAIRRDNRRQTGETIAAIGANGLTLSGSTKDYTLAQAVELEMKALDARYQANEQARQYRNSAKMQRYEGKQAQTAGFIGAGAKLLSAGGSYYAGRKAPGS
jgi:hypothetical protein